MTPPSGKSRLSRLSRHTCTAHTQSGIFSITSIMEIITEGCRPGRGARKEVPVSQRRSGVGGGPIGPAGPPNQLASVGPGGLLVAFVCVGTRPTP